jgi:hypothetical protein
MKILHLSIVAPPQTGGIRQVANPLMKLYYEVLKRVVVW